MNIKKNLIILAAIVLAVTVPFSAGAATSKGHPAATVDVDSLASTSTKPTLTGTAKDLTNVRVTVSKEGESKTLYKSTGIKVRNGIWSVRVSKKLSEGVYNVKVYGTKISKGDELTEETLVVGEDAKVGSKVKTTVVVESLPILGGGNARQGSSVPVLYLQATNIGKATSTLSGFWVKENGSASSNAVVGLTSIDDSGLLSGTAAVPNGVTPFAKDDTAFIPVPPVALAPGQIRLFTLRALVAANVGADLGRQLNIDVTSAVTDSDVRAQYPIRGTTWTLAR